MGKLNFKGFPDTPQRQTSLPEAVFRELLVDIDQITILKLILYIFWRFDRIEGDFRYLRRQDILEDAVFMRSLSASEIEGQAALDEALQGAVQHKVLLSAPVQIGKTVQPVYFLNNARGRAAEEAIRLGTWRPGITPDFEQRLDAPPNIFVLYEQNIGPLTPMIAEMLRDAEQTYPAEWIDEAVKIAVEKNVRNWRYVSAILERWQQEGRHEQKDRRDTAQDRQRYADWEEKRRHR
jgi:DnaD/phage-associated family protein